MSKKSDIKAAAKTALIAIGVTIVTLVATFAISMVFVVENIVEAEEELNRRWAL